VDDSQIVARVLNRVGTRLVMGPGEVDSKATEILRKTPLKAKSRGDFHSSVIAAGYAAKKMNKTMFVYSGNSYGHAVFRVDFNPSNYLNPINNTGTRVLSVTPDLTCSWHDVKRPEAPPSDNG